MVVTLWGATAEGPGGELEEAAVAAPVVAISSCRVSSYNGVSGALRGLVGQERGMGSRGASSQPAREASSQLAREASSQPLLVQRQ